MRGAGVNAHRRLVEGPSSARQPGLFSDGNCGGDLCGVRVSVDAGGNARTIRYRGTLDSCSGLGHHRVARYFRASLPAGRPTMARVGGRRYADGVPNPQFHLLAKYQLSGDHGTAARLVPRRIRFCRDGRAESLDAGRPGELAVVGDLCDGRHNHCVAAGRAAAGADRGRQHSVVRHGGDRVCSIRALSRRWPTS